MAAPNLSDEELLSKHGHRLPEHLRFIDAIVYHPFENNEDEQLCRDYVDRLKSNVKLDDQRELEIVLYDDYFVPDVSKLGKFGHAENFSHYKFVYITKDFVDAEHMQLFLSETSLINSIEDKNKQGTVIIVYKDKVPGKTPTFLSSIISLTDAPDNEFHFLRLKTMFNSKHSKQRKKDLEENVKCKQIKWLRENSEKLKIL